MQHLRPIRVTLLLALSAATGASFLHGQALPTATKTMEIGAWGGYMATQPDFDAYSLNGFAFGANFTLFPHLFIDPSVEVRYDHTTASTVAEHAFLFGPRLQKDLLHDRVHPYANFLFGSGTISYDAGVPTSVPSNSGLAYSLGGGVDLDITRHISLKADFQQQEWHPGANRTLQPQGTYTLSPLTFVAGATYHFQFKGLKGQKTLQ